MRKLLSIHFAALSNSMLPFVHRSDTGLYYIGYYAPLNTGDSAVNRSPARAQGGSSPAMVLSNCRFSN